MNILIGPPGELSVCVQSLLLASGLRHRFPEAAITWAVDEQFAELVEGHRARVTLIRIPDRASVLWGALSSAGRRLRATRWDMALDPASTTRSASVLWWSGSRNRIGWQASRGTGLSRWLLNHHVSAERDILDLPGTGIGLPGASWEVPLHDEADAFAEDWVLRYQLSCGFAVAVVTGRRQRDSEWPRFCGMLAKQMGRRRLLTLVVICGDQDAWPAVQRTVACSGGHAIAATRFNLSQCAALIRRARLLVSDDAGWLQLSAAIGTPALAARIDPAADVRAICGDRLLCLESLLDQNGEGWAGEGTPTGGPHLLEIPAETVISACARQLDRVAPANRRAA